MAPILPWLVQLKASQLKILATAVGINSSGTKPTLIGALQSHLPISAFAQQYERAPSAKESAKKQNESPDILSIDMGIKNLAYCRLNLPKKEANLSKPTITDWARVDITSFNDHTNADVQSSATAEAKASFEPDVYAAHAYTLLSRIFSSGSPTHVLVERQRFRSGGGSAVQEWTLRVNMFEAMLYAVLETLKREGRWEGRVMGMSPARVTNLWVGHLFKDESKSGGVRGEVEGKDVVDDGRKKSRKGSGARVKASLKTKRLKTQLVQTWLRDEERFNLVGEAKKVRDQHFSAVSGTMSTRVKQGKMDDLADCLLQGMAFFKWEENRRLIWEKGQDALLELQNPLKGS